MDRVTSLVCTGSVSNDSVLVFNEPGIAAKSTAEVQAKLAFYQHVSRKHVHSLYKF